MPTQLGNMWRLSVLALQYNQLTGAIPASLGGLQMLTRLDLSFNNFFGSIPVRLGNAPMLKVLDVRNNSLLGVVPPGDTLLPTSAFYVDVFENQGGKILNVILMALWMKTQL